MFRKRQLKLGTSHAGEMGKRFTQGFSNSLGLSLIGSVDANDRHIYFFRLFVTNMKLTMIS